MTGRRYRLYPDPDQAPILAQWIGCARAVYNAKNEEERYLGWLRRYATTITRSRSVCGHTESANRKGSKFSCQKCGHTAHADANASENIKSDGVAAVLTMLGRSMAQPCAEATRGRLRPPPKAPAKRSSGTPHLDV